jgi:hypothetical protein
MTRRLAAALLPLVALAALARADWLQPDPSYREAQALLRQAARDTANASHLPERLDSLGVALLRLGRIEEARTVFGRALAIDPADSAAHAAFGKLALFAGRVAEAESLLRLGGFAAIPDRYAALLRMNDWSGAAALAPLAGEAGRVPLLEWMAKNPAYQITGPDEVRVRWNRGHPLPILRVKINGQSVLVGIDTGTRDLILDQSFARRARLTPLNSRHPVLWEGTRMVVENAVVQKLELGGFVIAGVPAGLTNLRRWTVHVAPHDEAVVGVIGAGLLRRFTPTLDYAVGALVLRRGVVPATTTAQRVPFEIWGESELMVRGTINGGRPMAMLLGTGLAGCGVAAPEFVFEEVGVRPGTLSRAIKGAGTWLQGRSWAALSAPLVTAGPLVRDKVTGWSGALEPGELWRHGVRRDAILSHDFFRGQRLTIDWEHQELLVETN